MEKTADLSGRNRAVGIDEADPIVFGGGLLPARADCTTFAAVLSETPPVGTNCI